MLRTVAALSARRVAGGGEQGWSRWLVPALVVALALLGAAGVRSADHAAGAALERAGDASDLSSSVEAVRLGTVAAPDATASERRRARAGLIRAAAQLTQSAGSDAEATAVADRVVRLADRVRAGGSGATRLAADGLGESAAALARRYAGDARRGQETARNRATLVLGGGLVLVALLMWSFWARRNRLDGERRFQALLQNSSDLVLVIGAGGSIRYATPVLETMLGRSLDPNGAARLEDLVRPDDRPAVAAGLAQASSGIGESVSAHWLAVHSNGSLIPVEGVFLNLSDDPSVRGIVLTIRDVGERKQLEERLHRRAFYDSLTDLPNRELFEDRVAHAIASALRENRAIAVLFIDLDDFKTVNDSLGHAAGDDLLRQTARRLHTCTRSSDTAARLGGDEFAVLVESVGDRADVDAVALRIHTALDEPFSIQGEEIFVHASVGIASNADGGGCEELLRNADMAMYAAKASGKGRSELFRPTMHLAARKRLQLKSDLRRAVEAGDLHVQYQPLVDLGDKRILGAEALVRWSHPELGDIPPIDFIPLAEETGLIVPLGRQVLNAACLEARAWKDQLPEGESLYVSVNLSVRQFRPAGQIAQHVREATAAAGLDPSCLMLEVTESVLMDDREGITRELTELRALGARIAIDDFGTGYSALSYLSQFPIDTVKMDRSFVDDLARGKGDAALVRSVVELGQALDMEIIAEGIEHRGQLDSLHDLHCTVGQGFYFARPLDGAEVTELVRARSRQVA
jgi:diguanylate cyclase (GGDEF)-like protein/PAS domain S-box-containing protein